MNEDMRTFWDKAHAENRLLSLSGHTAEYILTALGLEDIAFAGLHVLDIGVGIGRLAEYLARHGALVSALDISPIALARVASWASWQYLDTEVTLLPSNTFDFALSYCVVQHMDDAGFADQMRNVFRSLKDDGKFIFQFSYPLPGGEFEQNELNMQHGSVNRSIDKVSEMIWRNGGFVMDFKKAGEFPQYRSGWCIAETRKRI